MEITGYIYKFTDPFGKSYIGQTCQDPNKRKLLHKEAAEKRKIKTKFYDAIRTYGFDSFDFSIIKTIVGEKEELNRSLINLKHIILEDMIHIKMGII